MSKKSESFKENYFLSTLTLPFVPPLHFYSRHTGTPRLCLRPSEEYGWVTSFPPIYSWLKNLEAIDYDHHKNYHCNYVCHLYVFDSGLVGLPINIDGDHEAAKRGKAESQLPKKFNIVTTLILIIMKNQLLLKEVTTLIRIPMKTSNCWKWAVTCPYHDQLLSPGQCPQPPPWYFLILIFHLFDIT